MIFEKIILDLFHIYNRYTAKNVVILTINKKATVKGDLFAKNDRILSLARLSEFYSSTSFF